MLQAKGQTYSSIELKSTLMKLLPVILAANFVTLVITIIAAIKFASWSYRLIALVALAAFLSALYQFQTGCYQPTTLVLTAVLVLLIIVCAFDNWSSLGRR